MEFEHQKYNHTFEGLTKQDVEHMLRLKVEKVENDKKMEELERKIKNLHSKVISFN